MLYNLLESSSVYTNTSIGNISLNYCDIINLYDESDNITLLPGDILCIDCDLGDRIYIDNIVYSFSSDTPQDTVLSGINFYYKNQVYDDYVLLDTTYSGSVYMATISGALSPRYLRLKHSTASCSGTVNYYKVFNDDSLVDFGSDGMLEEDSVATSLSSEAFVKTIDIYNNSYGLNVTANVIIEPQGTYIDDCISLSDSPSGPWHGPKDGANLITSFSSLDGGTHQNTMVIDNNLTMAGENYTGTYASNISSGTYISKIFYSEDVLGHINIDNIKSLTGTNISNSGDDSIETIQIRSSDTAPMASSFIRTMFKDDTLIRYRDIWTHDGSVKYEQSSTDYVTSGVTTLYNSMIAMDTETDTTVFLINSQKSNWNDVNLVVMDTDGNMTSKQILTRSSATYNIEFYDIKIESSGGIWLYFYSSYGRDSFLIDSAGYYLLHLDSDLNTTFKYVNNDAFSVGEIALNYDDGSIWYVDSVNGRVLKLNTNGTVIASNYEETDLLTNITTTTDGGCWYLNNQSLHKLDYYGYIEESLDNVVGSDVVTFAVMDDNTFYVIEGSLVNKINKSGNILKSINTNDPYKLDVVDSGVWIYCGDNYVRFFDTVANKLTTEYSYLTYDSIPAASEYGYDDLFYADSFPLTIDSIWNTLEWKEVPLRKYYLPENKYHQIKFTLRENKPSDLYDVATDINWDTTNSFGDNSLMPHIWQTGLPIDRVTVTSGICSLAPDSISLTNSYISSQNKWYIPDELFNLQIKYNFPDGHPSIDTTIYMTLWALDEGHEGEFYKMSITRYAANTNLLITASYKARANGIYTLRSDSISTTWYSYNYEYGYLRMIMPTILSSYGYGFDALNYNESTSSWDGINQSLRYSNTSYSAGSRYYVEIGANYDGVEVEFSNFSINSYSDDIYMYKYAPIVKGIYLHDYVSIKNIPLDSSKPVYIRTYTPDNSTAAAGLYNTNLRTWWEIQE